MFVGDMEESGAENILCFDEIEAGCNKYFVHMYLAQDR